MSAGQYVSVPTACLLRFYTCRYVGSVTYPQLLRERVIKIRTHPSWLSSLGLWPLLQREWSIPRKPRSRLHTRNAPLLSETSSTIPFFRENTKRDRKSSRLCRGVATTCSPNPWRFLHDCPLVLKDLVIRSSIRDRVEDNSSSILGLYARSKIGINWKIANQLY
jgi:hypothetical protein